MKYNHFLAFFCIAILFNQIIATPALQSSPSAFSHFKDTITNYARMPYRDIKFLYTWASKKNNGQPTTNQENKRAYKIMRRTSLTIGTILAALGIAIGVYRYWPKKEKEKIETNEAHESKITFDHETIAFDYSGRQMEGYWATSDTPSKDSHKGRFPFPKQNPAPWPGEDEFLKKLALIEQEEGKGKIKKSSWIENLNAGSRFYTRYHSRFNKTDELALYEFFDQSNNIGWTGDFGSYYVKKFHVKPSKQFYDYVMNYQLSDGNN